MEAQTIDILTDLVYLKHDDIHLTEKPYKLQYDPGEGLPRTNCTNQTQGGVRIRDFRGKEAQFSLERQGFAVHKLASKLSPSDFYDEAKVKKIYYEELKAVLKADLGATRVEILEHGIRKRHPEFPVSTGEDYQYLQPTSVVHVDFTPEAAVQESKHVFNADPKDYRRFQSVNVWKPLYGPVTDWPLALCSAESVDPDRDYIGSDVVTRTGYTENFQVYYNPDHAWYYLNKQQASEIIVFRQTDTDERFATGVPHAGFRNPQADGAERPRESVEARAFIYY
ncbi:hypothetical protein BDY21DRAFT_348839 [Lineolata rhizophorae]|uniref:CmcJ-like methyltransferase n=1 Tax=Lineolata rhizophorae TaxID=578093 RepID=A0A6A6NVP4_9PEZI|nr:hypothetical protein BDY21DRAFT_348839 [Lineolata rhizophorae]